MGSALAQAGAESLSGQREQLAESLLRTALTKWEDPEAKPQLLAAFQAATASEAGAARMRDFMSSQLFRQLGEALEVEPLASASVDEVVELFAPTIQRYLVG